MAVVGNKLSIVFLLLCSTIMLLFLLYNYRNYDEKQKQQQRMENNSKTFGVNATFGQLSTAAYGKLSTTAYGKLSTTAYGKLSTAASGQLSTTTSGRNANANRKNGKEFMIQFKNIRLKYWMDFASPCPANTKLIILINTRRDGFDKRQGIRQTWMNDSIPGEVIRFLVADKSQGEANGIQQKLEEEQAKYSDLVFLNGFEDQFKHRHLKVYAGFQWQQSFCANAKWVLKADDDAVIHLRRLAHWSDIKFRPIVAQHPLVYFGIVLYDQTPHRDQRNKWYISEDEYPLDRFPNFASGSIYLTTPATIRAILSHAREVDAISLEDVLLTGILAELANVTLSDQQNHFTWFLSGFDERNVNCENGTPTAFSMFGLIGRNAYEYHYGRLKKAVCSKKIVGYRSRQKFLVRLDKSLVTDIDGHGRTRIVLASEMQ